jgi:acetylornithine deacetylase/succinyl-diaminopimelate desuccinylase-like protein
VETLKSRVSTLAENKFNNAIQHSTISITSLRAGVGESPPANVIPSVAEATLDCSVLPGTSRANGCRRSPGVSATQASRSKF